MRRKSLVHRRGSAILVIIIIGSIAAAARASNYSEATDGDLSGLPEVPTILGLTQGSNIVSGATSAAFMVDEDYLQVEVPHDTWLTSIIVDDHSSDAHDTFLGIKLGFTYSSPPDGSTLFNLTNKGQDLLAMMTDRQQEFVAPLPGGVYTFLISQTINSADYVLDFQVVPEPTTFVTFALTAGAALIRVKRPRVLRR